MNNILNLLAQVLENPLGSNDITALLQKLIKFIIGISSPIVAIMILYAAWEIMTSAGDPKKLESGKKIILWTTVGYVIILIGWGFVSIIQEILGVRGSSRLF